ncbi:YycH family regulatory protein [Halobacillus salinus]|uniref:Regulatory protein YycH domain-containing protein n=1 Tax=Halobacillus salinus TaxID=192814 RepID=A0A4Z0GX49_9BACI|nr:two-component system activity regulator YycH [Halobacillus salinus]TGB01229.1 hypothetical protein E4663_17280 [Halobacillus salinus]
MKVETMKSVILVILIAFSLLLSVALWNYQPKTEVEETGESIGQTKLDKGTEMSLSELVQPSQFVFHEAGRHYSYQDPQDQTLIYQNMQDWRLVPSNLNPSTPDLEGRNYVEIIFPTQVPMRTLSSIFAYSDDTQLATNQSFDRLFITQTESDGDGNVYNLWAIDSEEDVNPAKFKGTINQNAGTIVFDELETKEKLKEQIRVAKPGDQLFIDDIFIPREAVAYPQEVLQTESVNVLPLRNYLFPAEVQRYEGSSGQRISDSKRVLEVLNNEEYMTYQFAILNSTNQIGLDAFDMLTKSIEDLNNHNGWTNDFRLSQLSTDTGRVEYHIYFNGLEIMGHPLATIFLQYEQRDIQEYNRPLVKFLSLPEGPLSTSTLKSGEAVLSYLNGQDSVDISQVDDIKVGYTLEEQSSSLVYNLKPMWYIKQNGTWEPLFKEDVSQNQQVS